MLPLILAGGGAIASAKQSQDKKKDVRLGSDRDALLASLQTAYSGFNGQAPGQLAAQEAGPSVFGAALGGGVAGYSQGQAFNQADTERDMLSAYASKLTGPQAQKTIPQVSTGYAASPGINAWRKQAAPMRPVTEY